MESSSKKLLVLVGVIVAIILFAVILNVVKTNKIKSLENNKNNYNIEIKIKDYGTIEATLFTKAAPITVKNFVKLVKDGFYDGLTIHRVVNNFMIQGGDPDGTGQGGSKETIKGEFSANGISNPITHTRGTLSMARLGNDNNSASSQFFIMQQDNASLDGNYAAFGRVTKGIKVVDDICNTIKTDDENGFVEKEDQPIIEYIKIVDNK